MKSSRQSEYPASRKLVVAAVCALFASGCAIDPKTGQYSPGETFASDDPCSNNARNIGIAAGAVLGAVVAHQFKNSAPSRILGGALGAAIGGFIGADVDRQRCELSKLAKKHQIDIQSSPINVQDAANENGTKTVGNNVQIIEPAGGHFAKGSDQLTPAAKRYFADVAAVFNSQKVSETITDPKARAEYLKQSASRKIFLVGHTDDSGSSQLNAELSERRAKAVAKFLASEGINESQVLYQGAGEVYPIADNNTEEGRAANRRVQLVEVQDEAAFRTYLTERNSKLSFFRPQAVGKETVASLPATKPLSTKKIAAMKAGGEASESSNKTSKTTQAAAVLPVPTLTAPAQKGLVDFGGVPYGEEGAKVNLGKVADKSGFSLFSKAYADQPSAVSSCKHDRPRQAGEVKSLSGKSLTTTDKLPGLYGRTWRDMVGGNLVVINNLSVLREGAVASNLPTIKVYPQYDAKNTQAKALINETPQVNVYQGEKGYLVRSFFNGAGGIKCIDMLTPLSAPFVAKEGRIIYAKNNGDYMADFVPRMAD